MGKRGKKGRQVAGEKEAVAMVEAEQQAVGAEPSEVAAGEPEGAPPKKAKGEPAEGKPRGRGIGARAKELILARPDLSFQQIADLVNAEIEGAKATANSCRWYAMDLRRKKVEVPDRVKPKKPEAPESEPAVVEPGESGVEP